MAAAQRMAPFALVLLLIGCSLRGSAAGLVGTAREHGEDARLGAAGAARGEFVPRDGMARTLQELLDEEKMYQTAEMHRGDAAADAWQSAYKPEAEVEAAASLAGSLQSLEQAAEGIVYGHVEGQAAEASAGASVNEPAKGQEDQHSGAEGQGWHPLDRAHGEDAPVLLPDHVDAFEPVERMAKTEQELEAEEDPRYWSEAAAGEGSTPGEGEGSGGPADVAAAAEDQHRLPEGQGWHTLDRAHGEDAPIVIPAHVDAFEPVDRMAKTQEELEAEEDPRYWGQGAEVSAEEYAAIEASVARGVENIRAGRVGPEAWLLALAGLAVGMSLCALAIGIYHVYQRRKESASGMHYVAMHKPEV